MAVKLDVQYKNRIKALMADNGFQNMESLAKETGISKNMLYIFERGESDLNIVNIIKILYALDCTFEELIQYQVESSEPDSFDDLSDDMKDAFKVAEQEYRASKNIAGKQIHIPPKTKPVMKARSRRTQTA